MMGTLIRLGCFAWQASKTGQNRVKTAPKPLAGAQNRQNRRNSLKRYKSHISLRNLSGFGGFGHLPPVLGRF